MDKYRTEKERWVLGRKVCEKVTPELAKRTQIEWLIS
ncbi:conserved hypothetical protein [Vibrio cholerae O1 str. 2010EL-1786]|uniref:Uncharacterized protein n=1 Tax=Vibrio cholerae serotype O1 (strain ATCC 39315 / El Tor Inaba N16961) TaxID=243277 RepID=Q9KRB3_VIBCH|nr:hypothetical protein VC_1729 [Vibrio cholerae O1 biovar El Tor str. N16961]AET26830.1 conserved hypothetical protein [Vibrio cholerae O1 str. 2010EL-1786]